VVEQPNPGDERVTTEDRLVRDVNGRLAVEARRIARTAAGADGTLRTDIAVLRPDLDGRMHEIERIVRLERDIRPGVLQRDTTVSVRDLNGRFLPVETRQQEVRTLSALESAEEETVRRRDINGNMVVSERTVVHRSTRDGQVTVVTEIFDHQSLVRRIEQTTPAGPATAR
jgi:hypothetical protein